MRVICDDSKPLDRYSAFFDVMIGRERIEYQTFRGRTVPMTFNLSEPLTFASSKVTAGLQIADVVASVAALTAQAGEDAAPYREMVEPLMSGENMFADSSYLDLSKKHNFLLGLVLRELVQRAEAGVSLIDGLPEQWMAWQIAYDRDPPDGASL